MALLRDNDRGIPSVMKGMAGGCDSHVVRVIRIYAKGWEADILNILLDAESRLLFSLQVMFLIKLKFMVRIWARVPRTKQLLICLP